jgi:hypothetical protein
MPYARRKKQLEFLRVYYRGYREEHAKEIAAKGAKWFKENQEWAVARRRRNRAMERAGPAVADLPKRWREVVLGAIRCEAENPALTPAVLASMVARVPDREWTGFLERLGPRDRAKWSRVRG